MNAGRKKERKGKKKESTEATHRPSFTAQHYKRKYIVCYIHPKSNQVDAIKRKENNNQPHSFTSTRKSFLSVYLSMNTRQQKKNERIKYRIRPCTTHYTQYYAYEEVTLAADPIASLAPLSVHFTAGLINSMFTRCLFSITKLSNESTKFSFRK